MATLTRDDYTEMINFLTVRADAFVAMLRSEQIMRIGYGQTSPADMPVFVRAVEIWTRHLIADLRRARYYETPEEYPAAPQLTTPPQLLP
jgi:hypothetical protein